MCVKEVTYREERLRDFFKLLIWLKGSVSKELVPFTQLVKVRRGKLVLALPSIRFS